LKRLAVALLAEKAGIEVEEALAAIRADKPDLVIADIQMPRMDGFALVGQLKEEFPDLSVLALVG
jgi:YesN/AraC family two-component response regulator